MLADRLLQHVLSFSLVGTKLPKGVGVLDPFNGPNADEVRRIVTAFHRKYYSDSKPRTLMLGINPGRLGAGSTGLSFTDTKRCESDLGIPVNGLRTHEPSSDFFYRMIRAAGGPEAFYSQVYVHAVCPLGFVQEIRTQFSPDETSAGSHAVDPAGRSTNAQGPLQETLRRSEGSLRSSGDPSEVPNTSTGSHAVDPAGTNTAASLLSSGDPSEVSEETLRRSEKRPTRTQGDLALPGPHDRITAQRSSLINLNYYDDKALEKAVTPFVENWLRTLVHCGMRTDTVLCIGTGKNAAYFSKLNERLGLFDRIIALEHPRYVMQYKARSLEVYIDKYLEALHEVSE
ncbi:MAG: DUF4918 family protein [Flavobacteriales bacterium]|nr:DUF4918 family protein [Flavobacteriales bacterium]